MRSATIKRAPGPASMILLMLQYHDQEWGVPSPQGTRRCLSGSARITGPTGSYHSAFRVSTIKQTPSLLVHSKEEQAHTCQLLVRRIVTNTGFQVTLASLKHVERSSSGSHLSGDLPADGGVMKRISVIKWLSV